MKIADYNLLYAHNIPATKVDFNQVKPSNGKSFQDILSLNMNNDPEKEFLIQKPFNMFLSEGVRILLDYDPKKLPPLKVENQKINFPKGLPFRLGEFGGKAVAMRIRLDGGMETSNFGGLLPAEPESDRTGIVSPLVRYASAMSERFSMSEHSLVNKKAILLFDMDRYATGQQSYQDFKYTMGAAGIDVKSELVKMGIDISKTFTVNGNSLRFENGDLTVV